MQETVEGLSGGLEYRRDLFEAVTIKRLLGHFENLLRAVVANPEDRIAELPLLHENERRQVLEEWNNTATAYPRNLGIHELFEEQVRLWPEALAAISNDRQLSYSELNERANQLAWLLQKRGVGPDTLVGVSLLRSERLLIALLGILKAGGAYVFLDASYPAERLALMVADSGVRVLVVEGTNCRGGPPWPPVSGVSAVANDGWHRGRPYSWFRRALRLSVSMMTQQNSPPSAQIICR